MPVLAALALLLLLLASSIAVSATRIADGLAGAGTTPERAVVEPQRSNGLLAGSLEVV